MKFILCYIAFTFYCFYAIASHIVGGEMTYKYLGTSVVSGEIRYNYKVTLYIYEDCKFGSPEAIAEDNPAYFALYDGIGTLLDTNTTITFDTSFQVPTNFNNNCITNPPSVCVIKKRFENIYSLPANTSGYVVAYQRCCRNNEIVNIVNPGATGSTYFCTIPPISKGINNSAIFKNYPPLIICLNNPLNYDNSATDADGDSLSYAFTNSFTGGDESNVKPIPSAPPYGTVSYIYPYSDSFPIAGIPQISIDPVTGLITGTPTQLGRYLISVCCIEWRNGVPIDTVRREFQFVVTNCTKTVVASIPQLSTDFNTYIVSCTSFNVFFENTSTVGTPDSTFHWNFGVPGIVSDTSDLYQPTYTYPDTGTFSVTLIVNPHSTCTDSITRYVKIYPYFRSDYADTGKYCVGYPISFLDETSSSLKPLTYWYWSFGDGDTAHTQNPVHKYNYGGVYNVLLISSNIKNCVDTILKQVVIDNYKTNVGDDTIILKGESVYFNATGGITYLWSPPTQLSDSTIANPVGYYPDTGTYNYSVYVTTAFGCAGYDTVQVRVVDNAAFFVPDAFTPNGDGRNDIFRPIAVGYTSLNYFRIFNRWGEEVYYGKSLREGDGWDGTYKRKPADMGVYFWELSYTDKYGKTGTKKGDITLVR